MAGNARLKGRAFCCLGPARRFRLCSYVGTGIGKRWYDAVGKSCFVLMPTNDEKPFTIKVVLATGLEPVRPEGQQILS
ncbi:hypothetical protein, partial [Niveispirillum sp.]|uniref:hypothetical protein n=1 Tax=Niveispirillum sp. TaxID=1917217 RepID=UPI001B65F33E